MLKNLSKILIFIFISAAVIHTAEAGTLRQALSVSGMMGYWPLDEISSGTTPDVSGNSNTGNLIGNPVTTKGMVGQALNFSGGANYVDIPNTDSWNFTSEFSVAFWIKYKASDCSDWCAVIAKGNFAWRVMAASGDRFYFNTTGLSEMDTQAVTHIGDNKWHHVAVTYKNGVKNIYIDSKLDKTSVVTGTMSTDSNNVTIGLNAGPGYQWPGSIDDVRIFNRGLSASEILNIFQSPTKISISPNKKNISGLVARYTFDGKDVAGDTIKDVVGQNNGTYYPNLYSAGVVGNFVTVSGAGSADFNGVYHEYDTYNGHVRYRLDDGHWMLYYDDYYQWFMCSDSTCSGLPYYHNPSSSEFNTWSGGYDGFGPEWQGVYPWPTVTNTIEQQTLINKWAVPGIFGQAMSLNGSTDYVDIPPSTALDSVWNSPFTISAWVKARTASGYATFFSSNASYIGGVAFGLAGDGHFRFFGATQVTDPSPFPINRWVFVAATYNAGTVKLYVDGVLVNTRTDENFNPMPGGEGYTLGRLFTNEVSNLFNGTLDDMRIYNRDLSGVEISQLYTEKKNITLGVFKNTGLDNSLVGYWNFSAGMISGNTIHDSSGNNYDATSANTPQPAIGKIGQALNFNGSTDYINLPYNTSTDFNSSSRFTVSMWVKARSSGAYRTFITNSYGGQTKGFLIGFDDTGKIRFLTNLSSGVTTPDSLPLNTWVFVTASYNAGNVRLYLNGNLVNTGSGISLNQSGNIVSFGRICMNEVDARYLFDGVLDEPRIYNKVLTDSEIKQLYNQGK